SGGHLGPVHLPCNACEVLNARLRRVSSRPAVRARLGILVLVALLWPLPTALAAPGDGRSAPLALVERLGRDSRALQRGPDGVLHAVFGAPPGEGGAGVLSGH